MHGLVVCRRTATARSERALASVAVDEWRRMCLSASRLDGGVAPRMGQEAQQAAGPSPGMRQHGQAT